MANGTGQLGDMRILIADDNPENAELLCQILAGAGYREVSVCYDPAEVPRLCTRALRPDLLLLDLHMPRISGYEILGELRPLLHEDPALQVLVVTADLTPQAKYRALSLGAHDFVTKPIDPTELLLRTSNLLRSHLLRRTLNGIVVSRTSELEQVRRDTLQHLLLAAECRDDDTGQHTARVGRTAGLIAGAMLLPEPVPFQIAAAAPLHDIGKIGIPDEVLLKPGPLTEEEATRMRHHVEIGARILDDKLSSHLLTAHEIALYHHENWDGSGYGQGLAGTEIPISARITAVADVFDALTHARPYKNAWSIDQALTEIIAQRERKFDPQVVDAFVELDHADLADPASSDLGAIPGLPAAAPSGSAASPVLIVR